MRTIFKCTTLLVLLGMICAACAPAAATQPPAAAAAQPTLAASAPTEAPAEVEVTVEVQAPKAPAQPGEVVLSPDQVSSAVDIETAMRQATSEGQVPGVVILDGRGGPFRFNPSGDRTINLFYSDLTLRGINNAFLPNAEGIYLDDTPADHLLIEGLAMRCSYTCLGMVGVHNDVTVRDNLFQAKAWGIGANRGRNWIITGNLIQAGDHAVALLHTRNARVTGNHLSGSHGVYLEGAVGSRISENTFSSGWFGVLLTAEAAQNQVLDNSLLGVEQAGVALQGGATDNTVGGNRVLCAQGRECQELQIDSELASSNRTLAERARTYQPADDRVVLTGEQVTSAGDIESAIQRATARGTRPGEVILDGRAGPFTFTGSDRSINIFHSNLTLRGINQAVIAGCDDGLYFGDTPADHILVEGLSFHCTGDGVEVGQGHSDVTLRENLFKVGLFGIGMGQGARDWTITGNLIQAQKDAIWMASAVGVTIENNHLAGSSGVTLLQSSGNQVRGNTIRAQNQGVLLGQESAENSVEGNLILGVSAAGLALEAGVTGNRVADNQVLCALGTDCKTVDAQPKVMLANSIAANRP